MNTRQFQINELTLILNEHFQWSKPRMTCFVGMLVAIIIASTVNLTQLALFFPSRALISSRYRRIQRFFHHHKLDYNEVAGFVMKLFGFMDTDYYLSLDRTNWKWGKANVNLLVLAVVYRGAAIPVYWLPLNKRGNSNTRERIALMKRFISQFGQHRIQGVLADREFIGDKWLGWMLKQNIPFYVRIRNNSYSVKGKNKPIRVDHLFRTLKPGEVMQCSKARYIGTCSVYLSGLRLSDGQLLILVSHHRNTESIRIYGLRWEIETLFGCLKGRGFKLEDTRMVGYLRIKKLLVLPVIAFCWSHKVGDWKHDCVLPIKIKTHQRLAQSIFRYGFDCLRSELFNGVGQSKKLMKQLITLLCQAPPNAVTNRASATC